MSPRHIPFITCRSQTLGRACGALAWSVAVLTALGSACLGGEGTFRLEVDATQLPRQLLTSRMTIPVTPGEFVLWYPDYLPGIHSPGNQVRNIGGFVVHTDSGERLHWQRDPRRMNRFVVTVPEEASQILVDLTYLTNEPTETSAGVDSYGVAQLGVINFNTCLLYPDGVRNDQLDVKLHLKLPESWKYGTSLELKGESEGWLEFETTTLKRVIDSPVIAGRHLTRTPLTSNGRAETELVLIGDSEAGAVPAEELVQMYKNLVDEADAGLPLFSVPGVMKD